MSVIFRKLITYTERTKTLVRGDYVVSETPGLTFWGNVHDFTGTELYNIPAGQANVGKVKVYSESTLNVAIEGTDTVGDLVEWEGRLWEIIWILHHNQGLIPHWKYLAEYRGEVTP